MKAGIRGDREYLKRTQFRDPREETLPKCWGAPCNSTSADQVPPVSGAKDALTRLSLSLFLRSSSARDGLQIRHQPSTYANMSGATIVASDSMTNLGVSMPNLPHVIFSFGTAPEYEP
jgi:hypothetical protein